MFDSVKAHLFPSLIGLQPSFSLLSLLSPIHFPLACIRLIRKPSRHSSGFVFSLSYLSIFFFLLSYLATWYQTKVRRRDRSTLLHLPALPTALCPATCPTVWPRAALTIFRILYSAPQYSRAAIFRAAQTLVHATARRRYSVDDIPHPLLADDIPHPTFRAAIFSWRNIPRRSDAGPRHCSQPRQAATVPS